MRRGKVYLVGAGPGDPDLITVKGLDCLRRADVVIYDRLVNEGLLNETSPRTEKIYVGKAASHHLWRQEAINDLLLKKTREGKVVVRLKGGDPFVLGRGGEEAEFLAMNRIPFEVVPGVSSAYAVPAYAGIPVTRRGIASSFTVVTGHKAFDDKRNDTVAWDRVSTGADTLVILMGLTNLANVIDQLLKSNRDPSTPVAVISCGTSHRQRCVTGVLQNILAQVESERLEPPAVVVVGEVVRLRKHLSWFDNQALFGKRILVHRTCKRPSRLSQLLRRRGAVPVEVPVVDINSAFPLDELDRAGSDLEKYDWLIFHSVRAVEVFSQLLFEKNLDAGHLNHLRLGVIDLAAAKALERNGLHPDYIAPKYTIDGFLEGFKGQHVRGSRVLLPWTEVPERRLSAGLIQLGAEVHEMSSDQPASEARQMPLAKEIDVVTFTNSSTVTYLLAAMNRDQEAINKALVACINHQTAAAAAKAGLRVDVVARKHTIFGLVEAMEEYFERGQKNRD